MHPLCSSFRMFHHGLHCLHLSLLFRVRKACNSSGYSWWRNWTLQRRRKEAIAKKCHVGHPAIYKGLKIGVEYSVPKRVWPLPNYISIVYGTLRSFDHLTLHTPKSTLPANGLAFKSCNTSTPTTKFVKLPGSWTQVKEMSSSRYVLHVMWYGTSDKAPDEVESRPATSS